MKITVDKLTDFLEKNCGISKESQVLSVEVLTPDSEQYTIKITDKHKCWTAFEKIQEN